MTYTAAQKALPHYAVAVKKTMAARRAKASGGSGGVPSTTTKAYDPTTLTFKNQQDFDNTVRQQAQSTLQPQLDAIDQGVQQDQAAHATRESDMQGWAGWESDQLQKAFQDAQSASNNLIAATHGASQDSQNNLAAALNTSQTGVQQQATQAGAVAPPSQDAALLAAAAGVGGAADTAASQFGQALQGDALNATTLAPVQGAQLEQTEQGRLQALLDQAKTDRSNVMQQLPGAMDTARQNLIQLLQGNKQIADTEQNQQFQQYLAQAQFDDQVKQEGFQRWLSKQQLAQGQEGLDQSGQQITDAEGVAADTSKLNWAQLGLDKTKTEADLLQLKIDAANATNSSDKQAAQARAQQWTSGLTALDSFIGNFQKTPRTTVQSDKGLANVAADKNGAPVVSKTPTAVAVTDQKTGLVTYYVPAPPTQYPHWADAVRLLEGQVRMSKHDAMLLLSASQFPSWRAAATHELQVEKLQAAAKHPKKTTPTTTKKPPTPLKKTGGTTTAPGSSSAGAAGKYKKKK